MSFQSSELSFLDLIEVRLKLLAQQVQYLKTLSLVPELADHSENYYHQMNPEISPGSCQYQKKKLVTGFFSSIQHRVFPETFELELAIVNYFKMISFLLYYSGYFFQVIRFSF